MPLPERVIQPVNVSRGTLTFNVPDVLEGKHTTVWKFQDFSVIQILREINFYESRSSKDVVLTIFWALNYVDLAKLQP